MWVPGKLFDLLSGNKEELVKLRTERDLFRDELSRANIFNDFLRVQINTLQMERSQLLKSSYGINVPTPLLEKAPAIRNEDHSQPDFTFDDIGDDLAKKLGLPTYN